MNSKEWSRRIRSEVEPRMNYLQMDAETDEQRRDVQRLWDLMNDICGKHERKAMRSNGDRDRSAGTEA